jgi:hypothetical protein
MALRHPPAPHPQKISAPENFPAAHKIKSKRPFLSGKSPLIMIVRKLRQNSIFFDSRRWWRAGSIISDASRQNGKICTFRAEASPHLVTPADCLSWIAFETHCIKAR